MGLFTKNQLAASMTVLPAILLVIAIPIVSELNETARVILNDTFPIQLEQGLLNAYSGYTIWLNYGILVINFVVLFGVYHVIYTKTKTKEKS